MPGPVAQSDVCPTCSQVVAGSMLWSSTIVSLRMIMKSPLIQEEPLSVAKEWALTTD